MESNKNEAENNELNTYNSDGAQDSRYPGYPHYPADEDITRNEHREQLNEEKNTLPKAANDKLDDGRDDEDVKIVSGTDADVTKEDVRMLEAAEQNMDTVDDTALETGSLDSVDEDGDPLNEEDSINDDMSGKDLDVPGSEDDDADENIGEEDEENNYYSLGGDNHEAQEEDNFNS